MKLEITDNSGCRLVSIDSSIDTQSPAKDREATINCMLLELLWSRMDAGVLDPENVEIYTRHFIAKKKGLIP